MAMESEKGLQELRYSEDSDKRKKLDGVTVFDVGGAKDVKDTNMIGQRDLESFKSETKYDLRKSLAWDSAFFTSPGFLESEELLHALNSWDGQNGFNILGHDQHQLLSGMTLEPEMKTRIDECSVRKSLAWDNAFLTSEGVLNPEELSLLNQGFKKSEIHVLPGIEELCMSSESNRTIDTDRSSLASLEVELFEDIRKSMNNSSKAFSVIASSSKQQRYINMQKLHSLRKLDGAPGLKVKSSLTYRRQTTKENQPERTKKEASSSTFTPPSKQFSAANRESDSSSSLKPPKILGRVRRIPMAPTKSKRFENGKSSPAPMNPNRVKTCSHVLSSTSSLKVSPLSPLSPVMKSMSTSNQFSVCKSSLVSSASRTNSANVNLAYSSLKRNCSPSVSIDTFSSHLSTATDHRCHDGMTSPDTICRHFCIDSDASTLLDSERTQDGNEGMLTNICAEETGSDSIPSDASRDVKPSGLRMPSPKIGFFDGDDSLVPAETEEKPDSGVKNVLSKVGTGNRNFNGYTNRSRPRELQALQTPKQSRNTKICPPKTRQFTMSGTMKCSLPVASKARNDLTSEGKNIDCLRNKKLVNVGEQEAEIGVESCAGLDNTTDMESVGNRMDRERGQVLLKGKKPMQKEYKGAKALHIGNDPHMVGENEKENLIGFQNQLDCLHAHIRTIDISGDVVIELDSQKRAKRDTPDTFTTLNLTPGISPTACPFRPNPAIKTSSCNI